MKYEKYYLDETTDFPDKMQFGEILRKSRVLSRKSQMELADDLGINQKTISAYERGANSPTVDDANYMLRRMGLELQVVPMDESKIGNRCNKEQFVAQCFERGASIVII